MTLRVRGPSASPLAVVLLALVMGLLGAFHPDAASASPGTFLNITSPTAASTLAGGAVVSVAYTSDATNPNKVGFDRSCDGGATWQSIVTGLAQSGTYSWTTPLANSTNCRLRGTVSGGGSVTVVTPLAIDSRVPAKVTGVSVVPSGTSVVLSWTNPADADFAGVQIYRTINTLAAGDIGTLVQTVAAPGTTWTDVGLTSGTAYFYHLATFDSVGNVQERSTNAFASTYADNRTNGGTASDGTRMMSFGGSGCTGACGPTRSPQTSIWKFDPVLDTISTAAAAFPTAREGTRVVWMGVPYNRYYVFGGDNGTTSTTEVYKYDPVLDTLSATGVGQLPQPRWNGSVVYAPNTGKIYYIGGANRTTLSNVIYSYDLATDAMVDSGARLPQAMRRMASVYYPADGCIYTFGGYVASDATTILRYCPLTGVVTTMSATLYAGVSDPSAALDGNEIIVLGGTSGTNSNTVDSYNPVTGVVRRHGRRLPSSGAMYGDTAMLWGNVYEFQLDPFASKPVLYSPSYGPVGVVIGQGTTMTVTAPAAGARIQGNVPTTITWTTDAAASVNVQLRYSCDGGTRWTTIATVPSTPASYSWTPAYLNSGNCVVRVAVMAGPDETPAAGSSGTFAVDSSAPDNPTAWTLVPGNNRIELAWTNPPQADYAGLRIYRSTTAGVMGTLVATVAVTDPTNNAWIDTGVANATQYYYRLIAFDSAGNARETAVDVKGTVSSARYGGVISGNATTPVTFGGCTSCTVTTAIEEYNTSVDRWTITGALPNADYHIGAAYSPEFAKVYLFGGWFGTTKVYAWDPVARTLDTTTEGSIPASPQTASVVWAPNMQRFYIIGGMIGSTIQNTIYYYDPLTKTGGNTGITLPTAVWRQGAVYWPADGCIYNFGGAIPAGATADIVRFCPATGGIATVGTLAAAQNELAAVATPDEIVVMGGTTGTYVATIDGYDPSTNVVLRHGVSLPAAREYQTGVLVNGGAIYMATPYPVTTSATRVVVGLQARVTPANRAPTAPVQTAPADGASMASAPTLAATYSDPDTDAGQLTFQVCSVSDCSAVTQTGTSAAALASGSSGTWTSTVGTGTWYWRVRGVDGPGLVGPWSTIRSFVVTGVAPTLTLGVDSATRSLGLLVVGADMFATTTVSVTTDNATGYVLTAHDESDTWGSDSAGVAFIPDWSGLPTAPTVWAAGNPGFGVTVRDATGGSSGRLAKWGTGTGTAETDVAANAYAGLDNTSEGVLHNRSTYSALTDQVLVTYRADIAASQLAGAYDATVVFTATVNP